MTLLTNTEPFVHINEYIILATKYQAITAFIKLVF